MKTVAIKFFSLPGLTWGIPLVKIFSGDSVGEQLKVITKNVLIPLLAIVVFLFAWSFSARQVTTSLGQIPGPGMVLEQFQELWRAHVVEREKAAEFYARQDSRNAEKLAANPNAKVIDIQYTGKPTYIDQIFTSLKTVFMGFMIASLIALPIGILCGLSKTVMKAFNPLIQIFKPVSPLAWLPIVTMIVSAVYVSSNPMFPKSFIISAITVSLCSMWATLINTALGVASVSTDYINVAKVLQLSPLKKTFKVLLPATLPLIFTGLRISLSVGWMVLIASEMLAQNPGLGKFIWDEFQNGSSQSLARIIAAVFTIGITGFILDRIMVELQKLVSFNKAAA
ncbi:MAG TPA: ABC transporter permease [Chryseolinea sp.]|nr:ABC transporter permease [Chryseolinea sp.]HPH47704.1 ABC transporter permease [Chryseolinea sp.]HPM31255.1 ABC transporter permease [Chryseolinea sp.]